MKSTPVTTPCRFVENIANSSRRPVDYQSPNTFLGFDQKSHTTVKSVSSDEIAIAQEQLRNALSCTVFHCYDYDAKAIVYLYGDRKCQLSHTFVIDENGYVFAISNANGASRLSLDQARLPEGITPLECAVAVNLLNGKPDGTKLPNKRKYYREFTDTSNNSQVQLTHSFICIEGKIYALSGNGHKMQGTSGKVKI